MIVGFIEQQKIAVFFLLIDINWMHIFEVYFMENLTPSIYMEGYLYFHY